MSLIDQDKVASVLLEVMVPDQPEVEPEQDALFGGAA